MPESARDRIIKVIRKFDFDDYGMDDVSYRLSHDFKAQEWVPELTDRILKALDDTPFHVAQFHDNGTWTIKHLLDCRPDLLSCPFTHARPDRTPPAGEYHVELNPANPDEMVIIDG